MRRRRSLKNAEKVIRKPATLADMMKIALLIHTNGMVWIIHDKPMPDELEWVDYDGEQNKVYLIGKHGVPMDLGLNIPQKQIDHLMKSEHVMITHVENEDVKNMQIIPFVPRKVTVTGPEEEKNTTRRK